MLMNYDAAMFLLLGLLAGGNVGALMVIVGREWAYIRVPQRMRYASLWLYTLVLLVAAVARGVGHEQFIGRYYLALFSSLWCSATCVLTMRDTAGQSADQKLALLRLESRRS